MTEVIDRKTTDPFGATYDIAPSKLYPGLMEIRCTNKRDDFKIPRPIHGYFTGRDKAQTALTAYLNKAWQFSDEESAKALAKRTPKKAESKKEEDAAAA